MDEDGREPRGVDEAPATASRGPTRFMSLLGRAIGFVRRNAYLALIAAAVLVLSQTIEFAPPPEVRVGRPTVAQLVGDAPAQEFSHELSNPQAVQVRATLRLYPDNELPVSSPDPDIDTQAKLLSQPVVTTILGMNATIEQSIRLDDGSLEIDLALDATPRVTGKSKPGRPPPPITLESEIRVKSRRARWWGSAAIERVHVDSQAFLTRVEDDGYRLVFTVDEQLFSLDLELHRAFGSMPASTLASPAR